MRRAAVTTASAVLVILCSVSAVRAQVFPEYGVLLQGKEKPGVFHFPDVSVPQRPSSPRSAPQPIGDIAFVHKGDIYTVTVDGKHFRRLTSDGRNAFPIWSPDGKYIAFSKAGKPNAEGRVRSASLCIVTSDGRYQKTLRDGSKQSVYSGFYPVAWLPDGKGIVYSQIILNSDADLSFAIADVSGKTGQTLAGKWAKATERAGLLGHPAFSLGSALAFLAPQRRLAFTGSEKRGPTGFTIEELYVMSMGSSNVRRLPSLKTRSIKCLRCHPKAARILSAEARFSESGPSGAGIWLIDAAGKYLKKLADTGAASHSGMDWSPEGGYIIYQVTDSKYPNFEHPEDFGTLSTHSALWVMKSDGTGKYEMLEGACHPNWR